MKPAAAIAAAIMPVSLGEAFCVLVLPEAEPEPELEPEPEPEPEPDPELEPEPARQVGTTPAKVEREHDDMR